MYLGWFVVVVVRGIVFDHPPTQPATATMSTTTNEQIQRQNNENDDADQPPAYADTGIFLCHPTESRAFVAISPSSKRQKDQRRREVNGSPSSNTTTTTSSSLKNTTRLDNHQYRNAHHHHSKHIHKNNQILPISTQNPIFVCNNSQQEHQSVENETNASINNNHINLPTPPTTRSDEDTEANSDDNFYTTPNVGMHVMHDFNRYLLLYFCLFRMFIIQIEIHMRLNSEGLIQ